MPVVVAYTLQNYQALCAGIAQGVSRVTYGDKTVEYRSLDEMLRLKAIMEAALGINNAGKSRKVYTSFTKGLK